MYIHRNGYNPWDTKNLKKYIVNIEDYLNNKKGSDPYIKRMKIVKIKVAHHYHMKDDGRATVIEANKVARAVEKACMGLEFNTESLLLDNLYPQVWKALWREAKEVNTDGWGLRIADLKVEMVQQ